MKKPIFLPFLDIICGDPVYVRKSYLYTAELSNGNTFSDVLNINVPEHSGGHVRRIILNELRRAFNDPSLQILNLNELH